MIKEQTLRLVTGIMLLMLSIIVPLVPAPFAAYINLFCPALVFTVLSAILCGWLHGFVIGAAVPLVIWAVFRKVPFLPDTVIQAIVLSSTGLTTAVFYNVFHSAFLSVPAGLLAGRIMLALSGMIVYYEIGMSYTLGQFCREAVMDVWPGLLVCVALIPLLIMLFRKLGVMTVLRHERYER